MLKRALMVLCAFMVMLPAVALFENDVLAVGPAVTATYSEDAMVVIFTGSGFRPNGNYVVRLMERAPVVIVGFQNVTANATGLISGNILSGLLADGLYDVSVTPVGDAAAESADFVLRIGPVVPITARINPQTGDGLPFVLIISFGLAGVGVVALVYVFRGQLKGKRIYERFEARKKRLRDLLK